MTIAVVGTSTWNKGAELMQVAIAEHLRDKDPSIHVAVQPHFGTFEDRARHGAFLLVPPFRPGRTRLGMSLLPGSFRRSFGVVTEDEVDVVIDASGFAFGDQHPLKRSLDFAREVERWQKLGKPVILLPQAFGPFDQPEMRAAFARIMRAATLIYARDPVSYEYAREVAGETKKLRMAPDFTNLVKPLAPEELGSINRACIVPNQRMIEKAPTRKAADAYVPLFGALIRAVSSHGVEPVLMIHGDHDAPVVEMVQEQLGCTLPVIRERDPVRIKADLGRSRVVIASRFHALVSALTQGVPAIATSWSHKYEMLFEDYGCPNLLLPSGAGPEQASVAVDRVLGPERSQICATIKERGRSVSNRVNEMWREIDAALGL